MSAFPLVIAVALYSHGRVMDDASDYLGFRIPAAYSNSVSITGNGLGENGNDRSIRAEDIFFIGEAMGDRRNMTASTVMEPVSIWSMTDAGVIEQRFDPFGDHDIRETYFPASYTNCFAQSYVANDFGYVEDGYLELIDGKWTYNGCDLGRKFCLDMTQLGRVIPQESILTNLAIRSNEPIGIDVIRGYYHNIGLFTRLAAYNGYEVSATCSNKTYKIEAPSKTHSITNWGTVTYREDDPEGGSEHVVTYRYALDYALTQSPGSTETTYSLRQDPAGVVASHYGSKRYVTVVGVKPNTFEPTNATLSVLGEYLSRRYDYKNDFPDGYDTEMTVRVHVNTNDDIKTDYPVHVYLVSHWDLTDVTTEDYYSAYSSVTNSTGEHNVTTNETRRFVYFKKYVGQRVSRDSGGDVTYSLGDTFRNYYYAMTAKCGVDIDTVVVPDNKFSGIPQTVDPTTIEPRSESATFSAFTQRTRSLTSQVNKGEHGPSFGVFVVFSPRFRVTFGENQ